ncbi:MAG: ABC transporter ATP-binding protein [Planctomycetota bacterium]|jgi:ABC-2 type transport system ATP-binding protein
MLELRGLVKRFGSLRAVDGVDLTVAAGSVHALLGPNGAGKTTLIKTCIGLLLPDAGTITVAGHDAVADGLAARRVLAYVPDEPYLYERLTGREFLEFTARVYGLDAATYARRLDEVCQRFEIGDFLDKRAEGYSHGMRQRVVLAAALLHDPQVLIVDEPLVGLDPHRIRVVLETLRELAAEGRAVLMSTHTLAAVEDVADQVSVLDHGRLRFTGSVDDLRGEHGLEHAFMDLVDG